MKCLKGAFVFLFVIAFNPIHQCLAQKTYDFSGTIQIKIGKKEISEGLVGTANVTIDENESSKRKNAQSHRDDSGHIGGSFKAVFNFEFESGLTECGDLLDEEGVKVKTFPQNNSTKEESSDQIRLEFDQDAMTNVIGRVLKKYGKIVRDELSLDECFSIPGGEDVRSIKFWLSRISGTAYIKDNCIKIGFSGSSYIQVSDSIAENQKRYAQRISGKLNIPLQ